ncbi:MAG: type II toxin-antitoxin system HipA family toxin [Solirubrobacterales bacterium]
MNSGFDEVADVFKGGVHAGRLRLTANATEYSYLPEYLDSSLPPVASTLPLTDEPTTVTRRAVPPFFAGLLPEGRRLAALRTAKKISADDEFSLLLEIGEDTIGDVQVLPEGSTPDALPETARVMPDGELDFDRLAGMTVADRVGLPGVQDKVSGQMISLPVMRENRSYILKLNAPEFPHVIENEAFFIRLAVRCGLKTVEAELVHDQNAKAGLLVTRFDRVEKSGQLHRLPVEDGCQCMGLWPGDKYSVTTEDLFSAISSRCSSEPVAIRDLFRQWLFALLTGNGDLHAKNVSFLRADEATTLSPVYDIPSTVPYGDTTLALPAAGKQSNFSRRQVIEFAVSLGMKSHLAESDLERMLTATESLEDDLSSGVLPLDTNRLAATIKQLRYRRGLLKV